ncbi:hypothetical protein R75461_08023 [Paraburkholderia nemoris]|uniref:hypothetical protein n=1 Tax=Paraburkholderia nemoris TaxID=2793076 RepID=UPI00190C8CF6|nr:MULTISPECIES: hypothetical protein [Paraburkholderia]MBK3786786.1 hypothetical protein [Paraburkholderia aspalathi]CAE6861775.1 hypothetical protein R75461_08023 [Paraburkholderia nemoris]
MKTCYRCAADALQAALAHAPLASGSSSLAVLHQVAAPEDTLRPDEACAQAGFIRRRLEQLPPAQQALLIVSCAPRNLSCECHRPCCCGHYPNLEWARALMGTRQKGGAFDHALARIDASLREAGIVADPVADELTGAVAAQAA